MKIFMDSTGSRDSIKSIMIVAGIPLAFSAACSLIARIKDANVNVSSSLHHQIPETKFEGMRGDDEDTHDMNHLKQQMVALTSKIEELQELEHEIEGRFFRFIKLKDEEHALMEVHNRLVLEKERAEFLEREVSSMEVENKKFDEMVLDYLKALEELESSRLENGLLRRRVKKLLKKARKMRKQNSKLEAKEAEMLSNKAELTRKEIAIRKFEHEIEELKEMISRLEDNRQEVLNNLEAAESTVLSKAEAEGKLREKYSEVFNELQVLRKDRKAEEKELIYLRWCHACLKHELARRKQLEQEAKPDDKSIDELRSGFVGNIECARREDEQCHPKRGWLVRKMKKWADHGSEKHHQGKCFRSHSVVDEAEEPRSPGSGRKSFSSA